MVIDFLMLLLFGAPTLTINSDDHMISYLCLYLSPDILFTSGQINTVPMKYQVGYLDVVGKFIISHHHLLSTLSSRNVLHPDLL